MGRFAGLSAGHVQEFVVVPRDGSAYTLPVAATEWTIRLRERAQGRSDADRARRDAAADLEASEGSDFMMNVQYVEADVGPDGTAYVEGYAKSPVMVRVTAFVRVGALTDSDEAPVGRVTLIPIHPPAR